MKINLELIQLNISYENTIEGDKTNSYVIASALEHVESLNYT